MSVLARSRSSLLRALLPVPRLAAPCSLCSLPPTPSAQRILRPAGAVEIRRSLLTPPGSLGSKIGTQPSPDGDGTIPVVLVPDAKSIWGEFGAVVDVREKNEVDEGMIPNALHMPLATVLANPAQKQLPKDKKVLVYCRAGIRSAKAVAAMRRAGIDAVNLGGGYLAWLGDQERK